MDLGGRPIGRSDLLQLLQAANHSRHRRFRKAGLPVGDADFADIDVAFRIQRDAVRREKFAGIETGAVFTAEARDPISLAVEDAQARAEIGRGAVDRHPRAELAHNEIRLLPSAAMQRAGAVQEIPLRLVFAIAVEHLHAMVLAIGDIDPALGIGDDVVHDIELAGIGARLAPAFYQFAVRSEFMHAGVAVTIRHIDLAFR